MLWSGTIDASNAPRLIPAQRMGRMRDEINSTGGVIMSTSSGLKRGPELGKCSSGRDAFDFNLEAPMAAGISGTRAALESVRLASSV